MHWDSNRTSVNWIGLEDRGVSPLWRARLISWQLFVYHVTTISPDEEDAQFHRLRIEQRRSLSKNDDFGWQDQTRRWYVGRIGWGIPLGYQGWSWSDHIQRVGVGWHHPIASLNYRLWQFHLLAFMNLLRLPRPPSPSKIGTGPRKALNNRISQPSPIYLITILFCELFSFHVNMG